MLGLLALLSSNFHLYQYFPPIDATADYSLHYHRSQMLILLRDYDACCHDFYEIVIHFVYWIYIFRIMRYTVERKVVEMFVEIHLDASNNLI